MAASTVTTSYLLSNLHCPSCVTIIKSLLLQSHGDSVLWVSPNIVTSVVTVEHEDRAPATVGAMGKTLEDAGYDIAAINTTAVVADDREQAMLPLQGEISGPFSALSRLWRPAGPSSNAAHIENCEACRTLTASSTATVIDEQATIDEKSQIQTVLPSSVSDKPALATPFTGVVVDGAAAGSYRATLAVGGMTCGSCANSLTEELQSYPWVSKVVVNLVANSATVDFTDPSHTHDIVSAIDDLGFEASLDKVVDLNEEKQPSNERDVEILIEGIFCPRCPERITQTIKAFGSDRIEIIREPSLAHPLLKVRYIPDAPRFTIRHILRAIGATDPSLHPTIYHPPTMEEKAKANREKERRTLLWKEALTCIIAVPTFVLGIVYMSLLPDSNTSKMYLMQPWTNGLSRLDVSQCILATPVYFFAADIFHYRAQKEIRVLWRRGSHWTLAQRFYKFGSMNMLMSLGTTIAYFSSVAQMIVVATSGGTEVSEGQFYFDSVIFLTMFLLAGKLIEAYTVSKAGDAVEALAKLRPATALLVEDGKTITINIDQLECGDILKVPHGASPAADGAVMNEVGTFDESSLTGESRLIAKKQGDTIFSGTINKGSVVTARVTGTSGKSMLDQIVQVVRDGQAMHAPIEEFARKVMSYFVPVMTLIALITFVVWTCLAFTDNVPGRTFKSSGERIAFTFKFAIAVFVIACPCGLGLAAPTAVFVGGGIAANNGIIAKGGGAAFEEASKVDCVVFDKTGTLTEGGAPKITDSIIYTEDAQDKTALLSALKAVEQNSTHPIAKAIVDFCGSDTKAAELMSSEELPGKGMKASCKDLLLDIVVGNESLMRDVSVTLTPETVAVLQRWKSEAKPVALVATKFGEGKWSLAAVLSISDPIRDEAPSVVKSLQSRGIQVWMISGDNLTTAQAVAQRVGIPLDNVLAEVLPSEKADKISYLQAALHAAGGESSGRRATVAMVGDGINDSPALTKADVGIAIGSGSDVAISSAAFVLSTSDLGGVFTLLDLSRAVLRRIRVNFAWAAVYNLLAVPVAAGCLYGVKTSGGGRVVLDPAWASLAMALSSISVVLSSLSLGSKLPWMGFQAKPRR